MGSFTLDMFTMQSKPRTRAIDLLNVHQVTQCSDCVYPVACWKSTVNKTCSGLIHDELVRTFSKRIVLLLARKRQIMRYLQFRTCVDELRGVVRVDLFDFPSTSKMFDTVDHRDGILASNWIARDDAGIYISRMIMTYLSLFSASPAASTRSKVIKSLNILATR